VEIAMRRSRGRFASVVVFALMAGSALRSQPLPSGMSTEEAIRSATALHDAGKFDDAIALLRGVVEQEPRNVVALYELAFSLQGSGKPAECAAWSERALQGKSSIRAQVLVLHGSCLDDSGEPKKAARVFADAVREFPRDPGVAFNAAITASRRGRDEDAIRYAKVAVHERPSHASSHYILALSYAAEGHRFPALLAATRFLSLENEGKRAAEIAGLARRALERGVTATSENQVNLSIGGEKKSREGNFEMLALMVGMLATMPHTDEGKKKPAAEQLAGMVDGLVSLLAEDHRKDMGPSFVLDEYQSLFAAVDEAKLGTAFGIHVFDALDLAGRDAWREKHADEVKRLAAVLAAHAR
jgi:tetratricopeptide (TPR) repeat protein